MSEAQYARVNGAWPEATPKPTAQEAIAGTRLLLREGFRFYGMASHANQKRKFKITSGRRHTWPRRGVWHVNPDRTHSAFAGWKEIVHSVSHWCHAKRYPDIRGHDISHAALEKHLVEYVIAKAWLQGALKREPRPASPKADVRSVRYQRVLLKLQAWRTKAKRAKTAITKLEKQQRYYEKALATNAD